ncbi:MAG TPA: hypothetical protein VGQ55_15840, partial [Pyrinomonadaceae bacterium]|nr:hypothetical protein [Pyrinomonadaceae bacterium]
MQELNLNDSSDTEIEERKPFWRRQFQEEATRPQKTFDWIFGVILPTFCAAADPIVFRGAGMGKGPLLGSAKAFAFVLSFVSIMTMIGWLLAGQRLKYFGSAIGGLFFVGALISFCVGLLVLPFSLLGLFFYFIGLLGFVPLFAAFVFLRNGWRAVKIVGLILRDNL